MNGQEAGRWRIVLVEDDASVRRFAAMALEGPGIELVECVDVAQATAALRQRPADLVVSDLMMPGESGLVLAERLARQPALRGNARVVVFSAGVQADVRAQLEALGVWRILLKPVSLATLRGCVEDARRGAAGPPAASVSPSDADEAGCVAEYFDGDQALYDSYKALCLDQFRLDLQAGDAACAAADGEALKHLAHSLKAVLQSLGHSRLSEAARRIEQAAAASDVAGAAVLWAAFRPGFSSLIADADPPA